MRWVILSALGAENKVFGYTPLPLKAFDLILYVLSIKNRLKSRLFITLAGVTGELHSLSINTDAVACRGQRVSFRVR